MASTTEERFAGGSLMAAIANAVVQITAEYTGRGPTKARASLRDDLVVVLMKDTLTKGERSLQTAGESDLVIQTRVGYQKAMQARQSPIAGHTSSSIAIMRPPARSSAAMAERRSRSPGQGPRRSR